MDSLRGRGLNWANDLLQTTLGPRNNVLDRVRFLFLLFFVINAAWSALLILETRNPHLQELLASYALTFLVLYASYTYLRERPRAWLDAIAGVALLAAGADAFRSPIRAYLLFYAALLFRGLFGRALGVSGVALLFLAAMLGSVSLYTIEMGGNPIDVVQVLINVPGFAATAWLMHSVKSTLSRYIEALRREHVLVKAGDELAGATSQPEVYAAAVSAADEMASVAPGHGAAMSVSNGRAQRLVATAAPLTILERPLEARAAALPAGFTGVADQSKLLRSVVSDQWPGGEAIGFTMGESRCIAPLLIEGKVRGFLFTYATGHLPDEFEDGFARLAAAASLALERVILAEQNKLQEDRLRASEARFRSLVQNSSDVITLLDEQGRITYISPAVEKLLGYEPGELLTSRLFKIVHAEDLNEADQIFQGLIRQRAGQELLATRWRAKDGEYRYMETVLSNQLADPDVNAVVLNTRDVTERQRLEDQLREIAYYDSLTKLPNRALFKDRVARSLAYHRDTRGRLAVLFLDLDDFKHVNDSLGHAAGDGLLKAVAERLHDCVGPSDTVARFGGDEFAVLIDNIADEGYAQEVAERILGAFRLPLQIGQLEIVTAFSIGIALSSADSQDAEELLRNADVAMYRAKGRGKRTAEVFEVSMHAAALERLELEYELRQAIERRELTIEYQPIVWIDSDQISGVEALVRWYHPVKGRITPDRFIPLAEETGLIVPLGIQVLERACEDARAWEQAFPERPLRLSVNLSVRQLQRPAIAAEVRNVLKRTGLRPERLTLEITESAVMREGEDTGDKLQKLRSAGMKVAIDDFGTGYSSLSYLARFPIDTIKIDQAFVRQIGRGGKNSTALLKAIVGLGHSLGVEIVAEGIETRQQAKILSGTAGVRGQGWYFSKSVDADAILEMLGRPHVRAGSELAPARRAKLTLIEGSSEVS